MCLGNVSFQSVSASSQQIYIFLVRKLCKIIQDKSGPTWCLLDFLDVLVQCVVPYLTSFMDEKAAQAISQAFLDQSYEVTQERVKEVSARTSLVVAALMCSFGL